MQIIYKHEVAYKGTMEASFPDKDLALLIKNKDLRPLVAVNLTKVDLNGVIEFLIKLRDERWPI